ncbi:MAG: peptide deformylase, partial [Patescibacteria group bacterium]
PRMVVVDVQPKREGGPGKLECFINPKIINSSVTTNRSTSEACFSSLCTSCELPSPDWLTFTAYTPDGRNIRSRRLSNLSARILRHEVDHLDGIRPPDRALKAGIPIHWVDVEHAAVYSKEYRQQRKAAEAARITSMAMPVWDPQTPSEQWAAIAGGAIHVPRLPISQQA